MFRPRSIAIALLAFGLFPALGWGAPQRPQNKRTARLKPAAKRQADPVAQPAPPPAPLTPEQMPAQPPQVSYLNGQLTIISRNSTLADILHAVSRQTGAVIEVPPGGGFERVAGRMGPGAARDVLAELLNGSRYDYVMIASAANPRGLQHVILTPKTAGSEGPAPNAPVAAYQPQPQPEQQVVPDEAEVPPDASADDQEMPTAEEPPVEAQPQDQNQQPQAYGQGQPGMPQTPGVKTPEQLLQELQRMQQLQQQQQQQQQQQNPR